MATRSLGTAPLAVVLLGLAAACHGGESTGPATIPPPAPPPAPAPQMIFTTPIAGTPMRDVFYGAYFDHAGRDYECGFKWYSGHLGVDILLRNFAVQDSGVAVLAAAPGTVFDLHDGEFDRLTQNGTGARSNYVALEHGVGGPRSYYHHMRKGSIRVSWNDEVKRGDTLGLVGSSGNSNWPHLHFEVVDSSVSASVDPFRGSCNPLATGPTWISQLAWQGQFAVLDAGISNQPLGFPQLLERPKDAGTITGADQAVVLWANLLNIQATSTRTSLLDATGAVITEVTTGPVATYSTTFLVSAFPVAGVLSKAGSYTVALRVITSATGGDREVVRRTFSYDPGATPSPHRTAGPGQVRAPVVWVSPAGGEAEPTKPQAG